MPAEETRAATRSRTRGGASRDGGARARTQPRAGPAGGRRTGPLVAAVLVLAAAVVALSVALAVRGDDEGETTSVQERTAQLEQEQAQRDAQEVGQLTDLAREAAAQLAPLATALAPAGDAPAAAPPPAELAGAARDVAALEERLAAGPTGSTGVNLTREALVSSARLFAASVEAHRLAADPALPAAGAERATRLGAELGEQARDAFSTASTQLDLASIAAGNGHVHVGLTPGDDPHDE